METNLEEIFIDEKTSYFLKLAKFKRRVMLIGMHGCGKTETVLAIAKKLGLRLLYFSTPTIDPWCDLVGLPVTRWDPEQNKMLMTFCRRDDLENAEWIFFDEINRGHPKSQNALLEITQFGSINGIELKYKPFVWAGMNPPNVEMNYAVNELDRALMDRFHKYIEVHANPVLSIYVGKGISEQTAERTIAWWHAQGEKIQASVTPRRLEYVMQDFEMGLPILDSVLPAQLLPDKNEIPMNSLLTALNAKASTGEVKLKLGDFSADWIISNYDSAIWLSHQSDSQPLAEAIKKMKAKDLNKILPVLKQMKKEFQFAIHEHCSGSIDKASDKAKSLFPNLLNWTVETRKSMNEALVSPAIVPPNANNTPATNP